MPPLLLLALLAAGPVRGEVRGPPPPASAPSPPVRPRPVPPLLKPLVHKAPGGMFLIIPVVDTDPDRGTALGLMPVWVLQDPAEPKRIRQIHAPSIDYNPTFGPTASYRYFLYAKRDSELKLRAAASEIIMHELLVDYQDRTIAGSRVSAGIRAQWNVDGSMRFYGLGPATPSSHQTNYTLDYLGYKGFVGYPVAGDTLYLYATQRLNGVHVANGPIHDLPPIGALFPEDVPQHRHQDGAGGLALTYDSRDEPDAPTQGLYATFTAESAQRGAASEYAYQRYGSDLRGFFKRGGERRVVTAVRVRFDQVTGPPVPFWLQPQLGGKFSLRSYGDGRFTDRGLLSASLEERFLVYQLHVEDESGELELGPFVEAGTVFARPSAMQARYVRPSFGFAVRAVARPQVVVSIDVGAGQEGAATFMDINYSF